MQSIDLIWNYFVAVENQTHILGCIIEIRNCFAIIVCRFVVTFTFFKGFSHQL